MISWFGFALFEWMRVYLCCIFIVPFRSVVVVVVVVVAAVVVVVV